MVLPAAAEHLTLTPVKMVAQEKIGRTLTSHLVDYNNHMIRPMEDRGSNTRELFYEYVRLTKQDKTNSWET